MEVPRVSRRRPAPSADRPRDIKVVGALALDVERAGVIPETARERGVAPTLAVFPRLA